MIRLFALIALCLCLAPAPCRARTGDPALKVTFITPARPGEHPFLGQFAEFMQVAAENLGIDLTVVYSEHRFSAVEKARRIIAHGDRPDYMVFIYQAKTSLDMLDLLETAGIKSVICATDVIEADRNLAGRPREKYRYWIGHLFPDDVLAGRKLADRLIKEGFELGLTDNDGVLHLAGVGGSRETSSGINREKGLKEAVKYTPRIVLDRFVWTDWERDKARTKTAHLLDMYPDARVFWTAFDGAALGVLDGARAKGCSPRVSFITGGVGWTPESIREVRKGNMEALVGGHFMDGAWALVMIRDYENGIDFAAPHPTLHSGMRLIDRHNLDTYLPILDRANWERIDFKRFTKTANPGLREYEFNPDAVLRQLNEK